MPVTDLQTIPDGADVFIDSNIFVYAINGQSAQCRELLQKVSNEYITGVTSYHVVGEVTHKLMLAEFATIGGPAGGGARKYLEEHPEVVKELTRYWTGTESVLAMNLLFLPVDEGIVRSAQPIRQQSGLLNNDSLIAACMKYSGLT
ncbi:MAG: type II toxin-antitoxin system VapC family toxin, partial [Candidatus Dormibacteria bacterium]